MPRAGAIGQRWEAKTDECPPPTLTNAWVRGTGRSMAHDTEPNESGADAHERAAHRHRLLARVWLERGEDRRAEIELANAEAEEQAAAELRTASS